MKIHPVRKLRPAPNLTSGQKYAREALACVLIGLAIAGLLWWGLPQ